MQRYEETKTITLRVNGEERELSVRPGDTLLHTLRDGLGLTGTKMGCENGDCGSCTVLLDGVPVKSCYTLTLDALGKAVQTIEGERNSLIQKAFTEEYGFQCGFCTPGQIMNATALLEVNPDPSDADIRSWMESNLCRCTGYEGIERAVKRAAGELRRIEK